MRSNTSIYNNMTTLYLTPTEQALFKALPADLVNGWSVDPTEVQYKDSYERLQVRCSQMIVASPALKEIQRSALGQTSLVALAQQLEKLNVDSLPEADMRELIYGLGPDVLSLIIHATLTKASNDNDLTEAAAYSTVRHLFFSTP